MLTFEENSNLQDDPDYQKAVAIAAENLCKWIDGGVLKAVLAEARENYTVNFE